MIRAGADTAFGDAAPIAPGHFTVARNPALSIDAAALVALIGQNGPLDRGDAALVDTRELIE